VFIQKEARDDMALVATFAADYAHDKGGALANLDDLDEMIDSLSLAAVSLATAKSASSAMAN
jgi:hypothetical protein